LLVGIQKEVLKSWWRFSWPFLGTPKFFEILPRIHTFQVCYHGANFFQNWFSCLVFERRRYFTFTNCHTGLFMSIIIFMTNMLKHTIRWNIFGTLEMEINSYNMFHCWTNWRAVYFATVNFQTTGFFVM
jgi:hypothetical protein